MDRVSLLPLEFEYEPVEVLSKEFTKLNNPYCYRIHYLGTRPLNSLMLHKKYMHKSSSSSSYHFDTKKIIHSHLMTEKLQNNHYYRSALYYRAFEGMNPSLNLQDEFTFNSIFESGNLDCVIKVGALQFDLFLRIDSNTRGHTEWFYFSVSNRKHRHKITINICNLTKNRTLYESGMKPYVYSQQKFNNLNVGWHQAGDNVNFSDKNIRFPVVYSKVKTCKVYRLTFQYEFQYENDEVWFAYSIPYTYSQLLLDVQKLQSSCVRSGVIGYSLTGLQIPIIFIGQQVSNGSLRNKKNILITGRIHPGESNSSYLVKGFLQMVTSDVAQAQQLRKKVNLIVIPMMNPDGVVIGNSRTSAAGKDLNRQYYSNKPQLYPQVTTLKSLATKLQNKYGIFAYFDFHGHSRKKNTFMYGPCYTLTNPKYYKCRFLPKLIEKIDNSFRYYSCSFMIPQDKKTTARAIMFDHFKVPYTFTIQSSIGLYYDAQTRKSYEFNQQKWQIMGTNVCLGLSQFILIYEEYSEMLRTKILQRQQIRQSRESQLSHRSRKNWSEDQSEEENHGMNRKVSLVSLIHEIKESQIKVTDAEVSSDSHDPAQDLESFKLNEFNNLIVQSTQSKNIIKKQQAILIKQDPINHDELTFLQHLIVRSKLQSPSMYSPLHNPKKQIQTTEKFRKSTTNFKISQKVQEIRPFMESPTKDLEGKCTGRNFIKQNKQRYHALKKVSLSDREKRQVLQLPREVSSMRKSVVNLQGVPSFKNIFKKTVSNDKANILNHSNNRQNKEVLVINRGEYVPLIKEQQQKLINKLSHKKQNSQTFFDFQNLQIDTFAMTIKSFNKQT